MTAPGSDPVQARPGIGLGPVRHLIEGEHLRLVLDAVVAGNSPGTWWAGGSAAPGTVLLWDGGHCAYLAGPADAAGTRAWRQLFQERLVPAARARGIATVKVYPGRASDLDAVAVAVADGRPYPRERVFLRGPSAPPPPVAGHWRVSEVNADAEVLAGLAGYPAVAAEIGSCWTSPDAFRRNGFGYCAHDGAAVLGWCTAEYVSPGRCGIGIETVEAYQRRGVATATAAAFLAHCAARGSTPHWDAWADNAPSLRVAAKLGFTLVERYPILVATVAG